MRFTRRQLLIAALAGPLLSVAAGQSRRRRDDGVLDLRYSTSLGTRAPLPVAALVLGCTVQMNAGEYQGDAYLAALVRAIAAETSLPLISVGPLDQLRTVRLRRQGNAERAGVALERLLDATGEGVSWELLSGAASGVYSLVLRARL